MKKKITYAIFLVFVVAAVVFIVVSHTNNQPVSYREKPQEYEENHVKVFHDSKGRPHRVAVIYSGARIAAVDIDATTYLDGDTTQGEKKSGIAWTLNAERHGK